MPLGRPRKPIPGWDDAEVDRWLKTTRGTAKEALAQLMPDLRGADRKRALDRMKYFRQRLIDSGMDFSVSKAPPAPLNIVRFEQPKAASKPEAPPPPPRNPPVEVEDVASLSRINALTWTINQAATKAREMPADKSAASYLKIINEAHAELDQLRKTDVGDDVDLAQLLDFVSRIASDLPNAFIDFMLAEFLRRNPKYQVGPKARAV